MEENKHIYNLQLTKRQAELLSYACDQFMRLIVGQDWSFQELFEEAWQKRAKEATGNSMDKEWDGGWWNMRHEAEELCKQIKKRFWGLDWNAMNGIYYNETADILFDLHRVIRHALWLDNERKSIGTVDSENPMSPIGDEPLAKMTRKEGEE